mmetsp:Transcript_36511/g.86475  ORF Transcript_36511/g.86475 Transcript_36511/m.86475 type:complete len:143 (+) Transcript_36511:145-573(+)
MFGVRECLGCLGKLGIWKGGEKGKEKKLDTTGKDLESGGNQDWDFDSWDKPAAAATPPPMIQSLDDFDGLAPKAPEKGAEEETDYFGNLQTAYVPPVQGEVKKKVSAALQMDLDDDEVDLDSWETGRKKPTKKKGMGAVKVA